MAKHKLPKIEDATRFAFAEYLAKRTKPCKELLELFEHIGAMLDDAYEERKSYHDERSERWTESEAEEDYLSKTNELETAKGSFETFLHELKTYLDAN